MKDNTEETTHPLLNLEEPIAEPIDAPAGNAFWEDLKKHPFAVLSFLTLLLFIAFLPVRVAALRPQRRGGPPLSPFEDILATATAPRADPSLFLETVLQNAMDATALHLVGAAQIAVRDEQSGLTLADAASTNNEAVFDALLENTLVDDLNLPIGRHASLLSYCTLTLKNPNFVRKIFEREKKLQSVFPLQNLNRKNAGGTPLLLALVTQKDTTLLPVFFNYLTAEELRTPYLNKDTLFNVIQDFLVNTGPETTYIDAFFDIIKTSASGDVLKLFTPYYEYILFKIKINVFRDELRQNEYNLTGEFNLISMLETFAKDHDILSGQGARLRDMLGLDKRFLKTNLPQNYRDLKALALAHPYPTTPLESLSHWICQLQNKRYQHHVLTLEHSAAITETINVEQGLIQTAVQEVEISILTYFLKNLTMHPDVTLENEPTALMRSAAMHDREMIELLLQHGADSSKLSHEGLSAADYLCLRGGPYLYYPAKLSSFSGKVISTMIGTYYLYMVFERNIFGNRNLLLAPVELLVLLVLFTERFRQYYAEYQTSSFSSVGSFTLALIDNTHVWIDLLLLVSAAIYIWCEKNKYKPASIIVHQEIPAAPIINQPAVVKKPKKTVKIPTFLPTFYNHASVSQPMMSDEELAEKQMNLQNLAKENEEKKQRLLRRIANYKENHLTSKSKVPLSVQDSLKKLNKIETTLTTKSLSVQGIEKSLTHHEKLQTQMQEIANALPKRSLAANPPVREITPPVTINVAPQPVAKPKKTLSLPNSTDSFLRGFCAGYCEIMANELDKDDQLFCLRSWMLHTLLALLNLSGDDHHLFDKQQRKTIILMRHMVRHNLDKLSPEHIASFCKLLETSDRKSFPTELRNTPFFRKIKQQTALHEESDLQGDSALHVLCHYLEKLHHYQEKNQNRLSSSNQYLLRFIFIKIGDLWSKISPEEKAILEEKTPPAMIRYLDRMKKVFCNDSAHVWLEVSLLSHMKKIPNLQKTLHQLRNYLQPEPVSQTLTCSSSYSR
jgi:hypothetical protein